jgi:hypothetical protein
MIEYYIDRDKINIADYEDKILKKLCKLKENIKNNVLPDRDFKIVMKKYNDNINFEYQKDKVEYKSDWMCISKMMTGGHKYCSHFDLCWGKEIANFRNSKELFYE